MIGNFFLLIDRVGNRDAIVGEGLISECVAPGHYRFVVAVESQKAAE